MDERLDTRVQGNAGLAARVKHVGREVRARRYETVAEQIESGSLQIVGADKMDVLERLYRKADAAREGTLRSTR